MDIMGLKKEISAGKVRNLYIFVGTERGMMDLYMGKIAKQVTKASNFKSIIPKLTSGRLFGGAVTYAIRDDEELLGQDIDLFRLIGSNCVILCYGAIDGRSKFYKRYKDSIIEFNKLDEAQLAAFIRKEIDVPLEVAYAIARNSNNDFSRMELELDKLKRLDEITLETVYDVVIPRPEDVIFDMIKYVTQGKALPAFDCFKELMQGGESPVKIISLLYTTFREILLVQGMASNTDKEIGTKTGLNPWKIKHLREQTNYYTLNMLLAILRLIQAAEFGLKTGKIEQDTAVEKLLIDILVMAA